MEQQVRYRENFDLGWRFALGDPEACCPKFDDSAWRELDLPHDWSREGEFLEDAAAGGDGGYLPTGIAWYRKHFTLPEDMRDMTVRITFDGVYQNSTVYLNGHKLGNRPFGYITFSYDLTPYLVPGENVLAVRVDNSDQPNSRWYSGSGIYRHVWLEAMGPVRIAQWGVHLYCLMGVHPAGTGVEVKTTVENSNGFEDVALDIVTDVEDASGQVVASMTTPVRLDHGETRTFHQAIVVPATHLWDVDDPYLYTFVSQIRRHGDLVDVQRTPFGFRNIAFDAQRGFLLNGRQVKLNGVCLHHDGGCVGAAVPEAIWERRFRKLRAMGCNAIRCSHNPPAPEFLDLCDRMGFLVMDEPFDEWKLCKAKNGNSTYGYSQYYDEWHMRDLLDTIHRDRNHPSIVIWSAGNEIMEQRVPEGADMLRELVQTFHAEDPTRLVTSACDNILAEPTCTTEEFKDELDVLGFNYIDRWRLHANTCYYAEHEERPWQPFLGTEHPSNNGIRGAYDRVWRRGYRYYNNMLHIENLWKFTRLYDYVAGDFMWTGIDYIGECRWPDKAASCGPLDTCAFEKDAYYFYQSQWTDTPMLHLFPHWNLQGHEGEIIPVLCYTNCHEVELLVNGKSYGRKAYEFPLMGMSGIFGHFDNPRLRTTNDLHLSWDVEYVPGEIVAIGYVNGEAVCKEVLQTTDAPAKVALTLDKSELTLQDVAHAEVRILDADGRLVPNANVPLHFEVEGAGILLGADNGCPYDHTPFLSPDRESFSGLALAIVQAKRLGDITVKVASDGLEGAEAAILVK